MTVNEQKQSLRRYVKNYLDSLPVGYMSDAGYRIAAHIAGMPEYRQAQTVFAFVSMSYEVDTYPLLEKILTDGKCLAVPLCTGDGHMEARVISGFDDLHPGTYGIMEPAEKCLKIDPSEIQLTIVPCVACDRSGRRLGHGGGFYDRFLPSYSGAAVLVCPEKLVQTSVPQERFDRAVPIVITEMGVFRNSTP